VITFFGCGALPVYLLDIYSKSAKDNLDAKEIGDVRALCKALAAMHMSERP
jgi:hypothetical protein